MQEVKKFLDYLELERKFSANTVLNYEIDLKEFVDFIVSKDLNKIEIKDIRRYLEYLNEQKYHVSSISRKVSSLKSFFKYLKAEKMIDNNPMALISNPKKEKKLPVFLNYQDLDKLLNTPDLNTGVGQRDALILEMLYSTGIRVSELANLKLKDINFGEHKILILGKGNKERYVYYGTKCQKLLDKYLSDGRTMYPASAYLFSNKHGNKLNERMIRMIIDECGRKAKLNVHVTPHVLRHTYATHMLNEGADLKSVGDLLGHENLSTTQIYTHVSNERLRKVYLSSHPRAKKN